MSRLGSVLSVAGCRRGDEKRCSSLGRRPTPALLWRLPPQESEISVSPLRGVAKRIVENIRKSGITIYDEIEVGDPNLWLPAPELESELDTKLRGLSLGGYALRTRSKVVKEAVCEALGYPVPKSFRKTQPRFPGQNFDTYGQKSNNVQIWNEEVSPIRRYVLIGINGLDRVERVKVVSGDTLAKLDNTGTLTQKYQARFVPGDRATELVSTKDTKELGRVMSEWVRTEFSESPASLPDGESLLPIGEVFERLCPLIGRTIRALGSDQERNRGAELHKAVVEALGYRTYADGGDFPDVRHQLLEVKLQTATTVDLGLVRPDSEELLDINQIGGLQVRHCDVRYAVFFGTMAGDRVRLTNLVVTTGERFFSRFVPFGGKVVNKKLQIRLPRSFFTT